MQLTSSQIDRVLDLLESVQSFFMPVSSGPTIKRGRSSDGNKQTTASNDTGSRKRRSGKELVDFQKMLLKERKAGKSVSELAETHGVSAAYIYQLKAAPKTQNAVPKAVKTTKAVKSTKGRTRAPKADVLRSERADEAAEAA